MTEYEISRHVDRILQLHQNQRLIERYERLLPEAYSLAYDAVYQEIQNRQTTQSSHQYTILHALFEERRHWLKRTRFVCSNAACRNSRRALGLRRRVASVIVNGRGETPRKPMRGFLQKEGRRICLACGAEVVSQLRMQDGEIYQSASTDTNQWGQAVSTVFWKGLVLLGELMGPAVQAYVRCRMCGERPHVTAQRAYNIRKGMVAKWFAAKHKRADLELQPGQEKILAELQYLVDQLISTGEIVGFEDVVQGMMCDQREDGVIGKDVVQGSDQREDGVIGKVKWFGDQKGFGFTEGGKRSESPEEREPEEGLGA